MARTKLPKKKSPGSKVMSKATKRQLSRKASRGYPPNGRKIRQIAKKISELTKNLLDLTEDL